MHGGFICRFGIHSLSDEGKVYEEDDEGDGKCVKLHCCGYERMVKVIE